MAKIKLSRYDRIVRNIGHKVFKVGVRLERMKCYIISKPILFVSSKILDHITLRNGIPKGRCCYVSREYIEY